MYTMMLNDVESTVT